MATRSRIGIQIGNDVLSAYHHWDGYPEWLGRVLKTHYNTKEKVAELIDGGDMSIALGDDWKPEYYADRGEDCPPSYMSMDEYLTKDNNEEYAYVFTSAGWTCYHMNEFDDSKQPEEVEISDVPYILPAA
tara:strand:- start:1958 stop:2347 length:390 start_codon:yes stop_codon:yes gene_type:complete